MKKITDEILNDYIDNQLDSFAINELKQGLGEDEESLKKLQALKTVDENLHHLEVYPAPNNFTENIMERLLKQVRVIKPGINRFFKGIVLIFGLIITAVLVALWNLASKQDNSAVSLPAVETGKKVINEYLSLLGNFLSSNQIVFAGAVLTAIILLSILLLVDSHRSFKNRLKSITH